MELFKQTVIVTCKKYLEDKINSLNEMMEDITISANNETKSSVGDKHETARAMMQLEQEKLSKQILELHEQKQEFDKIDFIKKNNIVTQGSLLKTNRGYFLIASSIGKIQINNQSVFVISSKSPLAKAFKGALVNSQIIFNTIHYQITSIC